MEHDNPVRVEYQNEAQDKIYVAEFETLLGAEMFASAVRERKAFSLEDISNY